MGKPASHLPGYENRLEANYYIATTECENCDACIEIKIPKGTRAVEYLSTCTCPVCECVGTLKKA